MTRPRRRVEQGRLLDGLFLVGPALLRRVRCVDHRDHVFPGPELVGDPRSHGQGNPQRLMKTDEIVVDEIERQRSLLSAQIEVQVHISPANSGASLPPAFFSLA